MLHELDKRLQSVGIELLIARAKKQIMDILKRTGFVEAMGTDRFFRLRTHAFEYAWAKLEDDHPDTCLLKTEGCPLKVAKPLSDEEVLVLKEAEAQAAK